MDHIRAAYLVGCDGGGSTVRRQLGIELVGEPNILTLRQALFRCDDLYERIPIGKGRHYHVADDRSTFLIVQDDCRHFTLHSELDQDSAMPEMFRKVVAMPVEFETLYVGEWTQRLMLAESYGDGRVFLAGDLAHLVVPTGGLGMNTGVGDAIDLAWKLAGTMAGWGGPRLLPSYEAERRPIGDRNVNASRQASVGRRTWRAAHRPNIADDTPEGAEARRNLARLVDKEQRKSNELAGIELGYRYVDSPLIWPEAGEGPDPNSFDYVPTTWPGARLPHLWLGDRTGLNRHSHAGPVWPRIHAASAGRQPRRPVRTGRRVPGLRRSEEILDVPSTAAREIYGYDLLLIRPDLHVVWRGNAVPTASHTLAAIATGNRTERRSGS